ncbi:MAG: phosphoglucosamine mutase, partial [Bacteroides sp.]|nr:phosphoglucosamine mutase [Bacteroides sp.]
PEIDVDGLLDKVQEHFSDEEINTVDGVKIDFSDKWVHLRKSNTEPIIRVYSEAHTKEKADTIANEVIAVIQSMI